ncbi:hypothetical protein ASC82_01225 [Streptomyces sp. Root431]|uniref:hypothetical protein n=1 Tax=Streptomyces sp. Root431 TaxID=1736535 RepID=UPI0006FFC825|nr:hypothetical protein [Streptomyces sp. Root431]KQX16902.1 hypothetical protein ASC82_01225 [Streptomyces sp. Root431]
MFRHLRLALAQFAAGKGHKGALSRLLAGDDLPGTWTVVDERTWLTGRAGASTPWSEAARKNGSVTAWRSYHDGRDRWAWIQVVPLASESDAHRALRETGDRLLTNPRAGIGITDERDVEVKPFAGATTVWAREQRSRHAGTGDFTGLTLLLAGVVGKYLVVLSLSGTPLWDWDSASVLAGRQAALLAQEVGRD